MVSGLSLGQRDFHTVRKNKQYGSLLFTAEEWKGLGNIQSVGYRRWLKECASAQRQGEVSFLILLNYSA